MSPGLPIERNSDTPIRPKDIDGDSAFIGAFDKREQEVLALWIVRLCQARRSWRPFKITELADYYAIHYGAKAEDFERNLGSLTKHDWLLLKNGVVTITTAFVALCYLHAPILGLPLKKRVRKPKVDDRISRYERLMAKSCI
jgi:hypothetical protein